jgi:hypothetical protein
MISLTLNSVAIVLEKPFKGLASDTIAAIAARSPKRVVFIDTPPMEGLVTAIRQVQQAVPGVKVLVRDHHDVEAANPDGRDKQIREAANAVRELLGNDAVISTRAAHPACSLLIQTGEYADGSTLIIADVDLDGLTGAMKACGITYPELDSDAAILDGPRSMQSGLSPVAKLLTQGLASVPPFDPQRPQAHEAAKTELYSKFVAAVCGDEQAKTWLQGKVEVYERSVAEAQRLIQTAQEVAPGVWLVDVTSASHYDMATLAAALDNRPGCKLTVQKKAQGPIAQKHGGVQYSMAVPQAQQKAGFNVQTIMPSGFVSSPESGVICNTTFLAHVSEQVWNEQVLPKLQS